MPNSAIRCALRTAGALFSTVWLLAAADPKVLLENDQVRVIEVVDQPHTKSATHEHKYNRVMIYLQPGAQEINNDKTGQSLLKWRAGDVKWSPASGAHTSEVKSNAPVTMIEVEVKKEGDPVKKVTTPIDPLKVAPNTYRLEFENSQVRVVRVKFPPKGGAPLHEHQLNRVVVYLTDQKARITPEGGTPEVAQHKAGEASWGGPAKHKEENLNDTPFEALVVELKN